MREAVVGLSVMPPSRYRRPRGRDRFETAVAGLVVLVLAAMFVWFFFLSGSPMAPYN
ncbi:MAG: hypothetical protein M3155_02660 [Actinomycetota bacterium]|nr:hypothetical protein [Actinomycetota bacterium]